MAMLKIDPARVTVRIVGPDAEKDVPLSVLLAGHTVNGQPVYKMCCACYNCPGPDAGGCAYNVALDYAIDGAWQTDGAWCDVLPLPPCPVVQAVADGKMTWADVFKRYWPDDYWQTVYSHYDIDDNATAACNAYATWQATQK